MNPERVVIDLGVRRVGFNGHSRPLTNGEFDVIAALVQANGRCVSYRDLYQALHGFVPKDVEKGFGRVYTNALKAHITRLRAKGLPVENRWGFGYRISPEAVHIIH
jgi:DNA-binding response OmpR family regulator